MNRQAVIHSARMSPKYCDKYGFVEAVLLVVVLSAGEAAETAVFVFI